MRYGWGGDRARGVTADGFVGGGQVHREQRQLGALKPDRHVVKSGGSFAAQEHWHDRHNRAGRYRRTERRVAAST